MFEAMLGGSGKPMNDDECSSHSMMSKLGDVCDQFPKVYHICKYNRMETY